MNRTDLEAVFKKDWYIQGFNGVPIFLNSCAASMVPMKKYLGYGYTGFICIYQDDYCEYGYLHSDLADVWRQAKKKIEENKNYLVKIKKHYEEVFKKHQAMFDNTGIGEIGRMDDEELLEYFKKSLSAMADSVGIAHVLEGIGMELEKELKEKFFEFLEDKKDFNKHFAAITTPTKPSFIAREENDLREIMQLEGGSLEAAIEMHLKKYFWIQNSYVGPKKISVEMLKERMGSMGVEAGGVSGQEGIKNIKLSQELKGMVGIIDFCTIWQDERKENILRSISNLGFVIEELSLRTEVSAHTLSYLGVDDVMGMETIGEVKDMEGVLAERIRGVLFLVDDKGERDFTGNAYLEYSKKKKGSEAEKQNFEMDLHGTTANGGTAIGHVIVCKDIETIEKVKEGDILVASMTRPEFIPALRKAAAIVTDEGGITCHAAIVARELGIPAVIGTKIATKILKDGMLVEVKANHGLVKIIK
ncbi:MAG: PEP-utilizing enzyme [Candidatus Moranbacteria bacterium]|nr:PEP-utilizing enzyme [Candidatus Moranbacteria bacterium]